MMCASSLLPAAHSTQWLNLTGHQLAQRYGMSEVLTVIANPLQPGQAKQGQSVSHCVLHFLISCYCCHSCNWPVTNLNNNPIDITDHLYYLLVAWPWTV